MHIDQNETTYQYASYIRNRYRRSINSEAILAVERAVIGEKARDPQEILADLRRARSRMGQVFITDAGLQKARTSGRA